VNPARNKKPVPDQLFLSADVHYDQMKNHLTSQDFSTKSEAGIERWVRVEGHELLRRLLHVARDAAQPGTDNQTNNQH